MTTDTAEGGKGWLVTEPRRTDSTARWSLHRDGPVLRVAGDIDLSNAAEVGARIAETGPGICTVDLTGVRYFGAAGIRVIMDVFAARPSGATLHVRCAPSVFRVMAISGLLDTEGLMVTDASPAGA